MISVPSLSVALIKSESVTDTSTGKFDKSELISLFNEISIFFLYSHEVLYQSAANASSTNVGMINGNTRIAKRSTRKRSEFSQSCIYFSSFYPLIMPEIWLNYGKNEVVLDIMAENLDERI